MLLRCLLALSDGPCPPCVTASAELWAFATFLSFNKHLGGLDAAEMLKAASMAPKGAAAARWKKAGTKLAVASMFQRPITKSMRLM